LFEEVWALFPDQPGIKLLINTIAARRDRITVAKAVIKGFAKFCCKIPAKARSIGFTGWDSSDTFVTGN